MSYTIRKLLPEEFDLLIPLMKNCFGIDVDIKYFEWKFLRNPAGSFEGFIAQSQDKTVAAYYGVIPETYKVDGKAVTLYQSCDTMTHCDHRRKGLFQQLATHCYNFLQDQNKLFVIGFGGGQSTPGFIKFGWRHIFNMEYVFCPQMLCYWPLFPKNASDVTEVSDLNLLSDILLKSNHGKNVHSHKDIETVRWRLSNPLYDYKVLAIGRNGKYSSYLCCYLFENKIILFDFYFDNKEDGGQLVSVLKENVKKEKLKGIVAFCQEGGPHGAALRNHGFITNRFNWGPLSNKTPFIVYSGKTTMDQIADPEKWNVNSFDHDSL
jgi:hypothetical protein